MSSSFVHKKQYVENYVYLGKWTWPRCIIHIGKEIHENIKLFCENTNNWETLKKTPRNARLKNYKSNSKWDVISKILPNIFRKSDGYHSKCYKKYTAYTISAYITEEEVESKVSLRSSTTPCSSKSSWVLESVCLSCNKKEKNSKVDGSRSTAVRNLMLKEVSEKLQIN